MVEISSTLENLLYSNYLPKADICVSIKKKTGDYEEEVASFDSKNITSLNYVERVDITGSELPSLKLSWEQNYLGEVDEQLRPIGYDEISEKMAVDFSVIYDYSTYLFWKSVYEKSETWKTIYTENKTWRDIFYSSSKEEVKKKRTFLSSSPSVQGGKIKWESRDVLYFLNGSVSEYTNFLPATDDPSVERYPLLTRTEFISQLLTLEGLRLYGDKIISDAVGIREIETIPTSKNNLSEPQIFYGIVKEALRNELSPVDYFISFSQEIGGLSFKNAEKIIEQKEQEPIRQFFLKNQSELPSFSSGSNISNYTFDTTAFSVDYDDFYFVKSYLISYEEGEGYTVQKFLTKGLSTRYWEDGTVETLPISLPDYTVLENFDSIEYRIKGEYLTPVELKLYRITKSSSSTTIKLNDSGTEFEEKNELNPFLNTGSRPFARNRSQFLSEYYNSKNSEIVVKCFGDPSLEPCDMISVETNSKNKDSGENVIKKGIVTSTDLLYNGAIKETITVHELS